MPKEITQRCSGSRSSNNNNNSSKDAYDRFCVIAVEEDGKSVFFLFIPYYVFLVLAESFVIYALFIAYKLCITSLSSILENAARHFKYNNNTITRIISF